MKRILSLLCILILCFLFNSCSSEENQSYEDYAENYTANDTFEKDFYSNASISITEIDSSTSSGTVKVVVPDLEAIYLNHREELMNNPTQEQFQEILSKNLDEFVVEKTFEAELYRDEDEWKLSSTEEINSSIAEMVDNYLNAVLSDIQLSDITVDLDMEGIGE